MVEHLIAGALGGFAGTVAMTGLMMALMGDEASPTQRLASKVNDRPPEENKGLGLLLHFTYGTLAGLAFVLLFVDAWDRSIADLTDGAMWGMAWSVVLWVVAFFWMKVTGMMDEMMEQPMGERVKGAGGFLFLHLVYGLVLGVVASWYMAL